MQLAAVSKSGSAATSWSMLLGSGLSRSRGDNTDSFTGSSEICCLMPGGLQPFTATVFTFWRILFGSDTLRFSPIELDLVLALALVRDREKRPLVMPRAPLPLNSVLLEGGLLGSEGEIALGWFGLLV